jgi:hypothetical protein
MSEYTIKELLQHVNACDDIPPMGQEVILIVENYSAVDVMTFDSELEVQRYDEENCIDCWFRVFDYILLCQKVLGKRKQRWEI